MSEDAKQMGNDFPSSRSFQSTDELVRYNNLARYVRLSKARSKGSKASRRSNRMLIAWILGIFVLACCLVQLGSHPLGFGSIASGSNPIASILSVEHDAQISSTPSSQWSKGSFPYLYQTDPEWANVKYADGTMGTHGCGPTCLSIAYACLTGKKDLDPVGMARFSTQNGYIDSGVTSWLLMSEGARRLGMRSQELPLDASLLKQHLASGDAIICSMSPGDFTTEGHFILIAGMDDDGKLIVRDPNSPERSHSTWEVDRVLSQCRNLWALSA